MKPMPCSLLVETDNDSMMLDDEEEYNIADDTSYPFH